MTTTTDNEQGATTVETPERYTSPETSELENAGLFDLAMVHNQALQVIEDSNHPDFELAIGDMTVVTARLMSLSQKLRRVREALTSSAIYSFALTSFDETGVLPKPEERSVAEDVDGVENVTHREVLAAMESYGGSFVRNLATAWRTADAVNSGKLLESFETIYEQYKRFAATEKNEHDEDEADSV